MNSCPKGIVSLLLACLVVSCGGGDNTKTSPAGASVPRAPKAPGLSVSGQTQISLSWQVVAGATRYEVYRHTSDDSAGAGPPLAGDLTGASYTDVVPSADTGWYYWVKACNITGCSDFSPGAAEATAIADADSNGLIEIRSLEMLNNIRFNLAGTSYKTSAQDPGSSVGCPQSGCSGYELTRDLDFDINASGSTWSGNFADGYVLDTGDHNATWFPVASATATTAGWTPVGNNSDDGNSSRFTATFDGNGYVIANLVVRGDPRYAGFFGVLGAGAVVRNLGLVNALIEHLLPSRIVYGSSGVLAGIQHSGAITASYATGSVVGISGIGPGDGDGVGGLVGYQLAGASIASSYATVNITGAGQLGGLVGGQHAGASITASHATGDIEGRLPLSSAGGLVGVSRGSVTASYATGEVWGRAYTNAAGGLIGSQYSGAVTASYATGNTIGETVGGLVGLQRSGTVTASYATGNVDGESQADQAGGLVGQQLSASSVVASYATGDVDGRGEIDEVGVLVGRFGGTVTASYGFGTTVGETDNSATVGAPPEGAGSPAALTAGNVGTQWDDATKRTLGAWDYGDGTQSPALRYADYDGSGVDFSCDMFPTGLCNSLIAPLDQGLGAPALSVDGPNQISLSWRAVAGATRYEVWRGVSDNSGDAVQLAANISGNNYTDTVPGSNTAYRYWIKACDVLRCSAFSAFTTSAVQPTISGR